MLSFVKVENDSAIVKIEELLLTVFCHISFCVVLCFFVGTRWGFAPMALIAGTNMSSYLGRHLLLRKFYRRFCRCALSTDTVRIETITIISRVRDLNIHRVLGCLTKMWQKILLLRLQQLVDSKHKWRINSLHSSSISRIQMTRSKVLQTAIKLLESQHRFHKGHLGVCGVSSQSCKAFRTL